MKRGTLTLIIAIAVAALIGATLASFSSLTSNPSNSFEAAATFPPETATGTYTGDGTDNRVISVGFQPGIVLTKEETASNTVAKFSSMPSGQSSGLVNNSQLQGNMIQDLTSNGFEIGSDNQVNQNGRTYHYLAIAESSGSAQTGSYAGDGTSSRTITAGLQPVGVIVTPDDNEPAVFRTSDATESYTFDANSGLSGAIDSLDSNGFTVSADVSTNASGTDYYWAAFAQTASAIADGSYSGDGVDGRVINVGWQPIYALVKNTGGRRPTQRYGSMSSGESIHFNGSVITNRIQDFPANGFELGDNGDVNSSGDDYVWLAFGSG